MPTRQNGDVSFSYRDATFTTNNQLTEFGQTKTFLSGYIDTYKEQFIGELVFRTKIEDYLVRKEQERVDSIADYRPIIAKVLHTSGAIEAYKNTGLTYDKDADYEVRLFLGRDLKVTGYEFVGYSLGQEIVLKERDIQFSDPDDASFLKRRGQTGESTRRKVAKESDDEYYQEYLERIHAETQKILDNLNKIHSFYKQKKVFIINQDYAYGEYDQFGLQFRFFNCYDKEIKYVEIRMTPYNVVDDVQADDLGRKTKEVRCIGPIEPLESAEYRFDELWWDEHNIIKYVNVTRIHIIFKDNTTTTFSSKSQVDAHRLSSFSLSEIGIDM